MSGQLAMKLTDALWVPTLCTDIHARRIFDRHYSRAHYKDGRTVAARFIGPGSYVCLLTPESDALFVWRKFIDDCIPKQTGINCAVFRNEGQRKSSELILAAEPFAADKWPNETRLYTYVDAEKVRHKRDPGRCFLRAGWKYAGKTKGGKLILEKVRQGNLFKPPSKPRQEKLI